MSAAMTMEHASVNQTTLTEAQEAAETAAARVAGTRTPTRLHPTMAARKWQPGQSGNPTGKGGRVIEMRTLAASKTVSAMETLIAVMEDPTEDGRVRVVAAQAVLDRGAGKVTELVPTAPPAMTLDLARLSADQLAALRAILDSGAFVPAPEAEQQQDGPPTIEG